MKMAHFFESVVQHEVVVLHSKSPCFLQMPAEGMSKKAYGSSSKPDETQTNCVRHPAGQKRRVTPFIFGKGSKKYQLNSWKSVNWYRRNWNRKRGGIHQSNTHFLIISTDIRTVQSTLERKTTYFVSSIHLSKSKQFAEQRWCERTFRELVS